MIPTWVEELYETKNEYERKLERENDEITLRYFAVELRQSKAFMGTYLGRFKRLRKQAFAIREQLLTTPSWELLNEMEKLILKYEKYRKEVTVYEF